MKKINGLCKASKKALLSMVCIAEAIIVIGCTAACGARGNGAAAQRGSGAGNEPRQEAELSREPQQEAGQADTARQDTKQSEQRGDGQRSNDQNGNDQISLDDAKQAALTDAGVSGSDVRYTKEKLDYEDGIAVYDIEFYVDNTEYEYEINATTGAVYSKSIETHQNQTGNGRGREENAGTSDNYIGADTAQSIALEHAGFSEADVSRLKSKFDFDDGQAEYEVEFKKDGREYEYKIDAIDGSIREYDVD